MLEEHQFEESGLEKIILIREENWIPNTHRNLNQMKTQHKSTKKVSTQKQEIKPLKPKLQAQTKGTVKCKGGQQKGQIVVQEPKIRELTQH